VDARGVIGGLFLMAFLKNLAISGFASSVLWKNQDIVKISPKSFVQVVNALRK